MKKDADLAPFFLGAHGEQDQLFEEQLLAQLREHFAWRRSFHPEDVSTAATVDEASVSAYAERTRAEIMRLGEALKRSVPVSSPRYIGHMTSDLLLPGMLAQLVTTLYNPNNVSTEVAPVTVALERAAAAQLAVMVGYRTEATADHRAWGHLTGGGTVANIEGIWVARAARCWPLAVYRASRHPECAGFSDLLPDDEFAVMNMDADAVHALRAAVAGRLHQMEPADRDAATARIESERIETVGAAGYPPLHVLVPSTAHYSWEKAVKLLGIGTRHLHAVPVTERMRMDPDALAGVLDELQGRGEVVLMVAPTLGTTEFGTIDPLHEVVRLRDERRASGLWFWIHTDAAWGGYLASVFRTEDERLREHSDVREDFRYFPSEPVYNAFAALGESDSITVDPHKLGYIAYGAGALLLRDRRHRLYVAQDAPYVFDGDKEDVPGRYALEGSRPGAMAAAVCVAHRVLPLHADAFGRLPTCSIRSCERLFDLLQESRDRLAEKGVRLEVPSEPDTNLLCLAINPAGNTRLSTMNAFMRSLYERLSVDPDAKRQDREFFASRTRLPLSRIANDARGRLLEKFGITEVDAPDLFLIRHTLMNPWLYRRGDDTLERYCVYLEGLVTERTDPAGVS